MRRRYTNIYVNCGNGTVTDNRTGLVWLTNANCYGPLDWHQAVEIVANLADMPSGSAAAVHDCGLSDGSSPGDWRLPPVAEWEAMVANALGLNGDPDCTAPSLPTITNDSGDGCWAEDSSSSFTNAQGFSYWTSTTNATSTLDVWHMLLRSGGFDDGAQKTNATIHLWPVRGGQ